MANTPHDSMNALLSGPDASINDRLPLKLDEPYSLQYPEEGVKREIEEEDWSKFVSLTPSSLGLPLEETQSKQGILGTQTPTWPTTGYAESSLITPDHGEQENAYNNHTLPDPFEVEEHAQRATPLTTKYEQVLLRDAKQVLAEKSAERKRKKQNKVMKTTAPRKRARGFSRSTNKRDVKSAQQRTEIDETAYQSFPVSQEEHIPANITQPSLSNTPATAPFPTIAELSIDSSLLPIPLGPSPIYYTAQLTSLTDSMFNILWQDHPYIGVLETSFWEFVHAHVAAWPYGKLRVLAHMGIAPAWWWVREWVIVLIVMAGLEVDDRKMVESWAWHEQRIQVRNQGKGDGG